MLKRILKIIFYPIFALVFLTGIYFIGAGITTLIPVNKDFQQTEDGITIFVSSNGMHTDLIVPVKTSLFDWSAKLPLTDFEPSNKPFTYAAFGWGDKGFYLDTPTWDDLTFKVAFKAMFLPTPTAMHVIYRPDAPVEDKMCRKLKISKEQYQLLIEHILSGFVKAGDEKFIPINCCDYPRVNDKFYEGEGSYHMFKTCNNWTSQGLKKAGIKNSLWAPFEWCVFYHLD